MVASELTPWRRADAAVLPEVMEQVDGRIDRFLADRAFDGQPTYDLLIGRRQELPIPEVIVPPRRADRVRSRELDITRQGIATSPMFRPTAKGLGKQLPATRGAA